MTTSMTYLWHLGLLLAMHVGYIYIDKIRMIPLKFSPTPNKALRWGADIFFEASNVST